MLLFVNVTPVYAWLFGGILNIIHTTSYLIHYVNNDEIPVTRSFVECYYYESLGAPLMEILLYHYTIILISLLHFK